MIVGMRGRQVRIWSLLGIGLLIGMLKLYSMEYSPSVVPAGALHDFHVSKTRLEYVAAQKEWQLSLHIFIDDLELALAAATDEKLFLGTRREREGADSLIHSYLQQRIGLVADGQILQLEWLGKEITEDLSAFWVYLYVPQAESPAELVVRNQILLEVYDDQQNIVELIGPRVARKHFLFHRDYERDNIHF